MSAPKRKPSTRAPVRRTRPLRVLMVSAEVSPFMKTGGLADAVAGLAGSLVELGCDVRVLTPAYGETLARYKGSKKSAGFHPSPGLAGTRLLEARRHGGTTAWLLDHPSFGARGGNPYLDERGGEYADNAARFDLLCRAACALAAGQAELRWRPDLVHAHDWHAGLLPVRMMLGRIGVPNVFTVHNLAYQGLFPRGDFDTLGLPAWLWHPQALEFYGRLSFIKGGLIFADRLTTVSPTFAREILTPTYGEGLEGVLAERAGDLTGIINGLDQNLWNPAADSRLTANYSAEAPEAKARNREALRAELGLADAPDRPLVAMVGRLVPQKGVDLLLGALPQLLELPVQLAILGTGSADYEEALSTAARRHPDSMHVVIGYDEVLAHRIVAAADMFLMPSRYEPCGLVQMEAMRYGAVPIVRFCGGLADTVTEANARHLSDGTATGFGFTEATVPQLVAAVRRAVKLWRDKTRWGSLMQTAMRRDFSWRASADAYLDVYADACVHRRAVLAPKNDRA